MKAWIVGAGRMGSAIESALLARGHLLAGRTGRNGDVADVLADVAFEFTAPAAAPQRVSELLRRGVPTVSGTTGWDVEPAHREAERLAVPFLHAANFSIGVAVARHAVALMARELAPFLEFEPGVVERHHTAKKDAPSGTANALAAVIAAQRGSAAPVPIVSLRQGGQPGEHAVIFEGLEESLELVHRARSRGLFAIGAVRAAEWLLASGRRGPASFDEFFVGSGI